MLLEDYILKRHNQALAMNHPKNTTLLIFLGYFIISLLLFLYSFTQVDLNLTLSKVSTWQIIQKFFQHIGYFQRPLSAGLFLGIVLFYFILYFISLSLIKKNQLSVRLFWKLIFMIVITLVLSYPAFSYDMFNYMFTAKTVLVYHKNPYTVIPLQFTGVEPWLSFMRWTHLPSAYTPLWIFLTLPAFLLGFGFFLTIMWNIKILIAGFYLLTIWVIGEVLEKLEKKQKIFAMAIFALNPLVIVETLVSGHNDIVMMSFTMLAILYYLYHRKFCSWFMLTLSIALKLMTIFLLPVYFMRWNRYIALASMLVGLGFVVLQREVLPWYWIWIMPFIALIPHSIDTIILAASVSMGLLLRYAPFLYFGNWDKPVPDVKTWVTLAPIVAAGFYIFISHNLKNKINKLPSRPPG